MATRQAFKPCATIQTRYMLHSRRNTISKRSIPASQGRCYASIPRKPTLTHAKVFSLSHIPQSSFESVISRNGNSFKHLSPKEYYAVAQKFAEAIRQGSSPWSVSFPSRYAIPADTIHAAACIMRQIHSKPADAFATALWASASEMGHRPATLSLARQLIRSGAYSRIPQLRRVEARFKELVQAGEDADALTAEGELLFEQGRFESAVSVLRHALQQGSDFEWRPYCELCLGKAYARMSKVREAKEVFCRLADEGMVEADVELVDVLRKDGRLEEAEERMFIAGCNGRRDMFVRLSEVELERKGRTDDERRLWALEWSRLGDPLAEY